jgi:RNA polymerase sigma-70 factor (ECF subfamily)
MDFESAVIPHLPDLKAYCRRLSGSKRNGEDLIQETLVRTYAYWLKRQSVANVKSFLFRIARNVWIDEYRRYHSRVTPIAPDQLMRDSMRKSVNPYIRFVLDEAADKLSLRHFELILLADLYGYSMEEIAGLTQTSVSGVKCALHRARKLIRGETKAHVRERDKISDQKLDEWAERIFNEFCA